MWPHWVGRWPLRRRCSGGAGAAEPSLHRTRGGTAWGLQTPGSSRQPPGAWSLHRFQGLPSSWEEDKVNSCSVLSPGPAPCLCSC